LAKKLDGSAHEFEGVVKPDRKPRRPRTAATETRRRARGWDALDAMHGRDGGEDEQPKTAADGDEDEEL
jgi:hypothetical protein